MKIYTLVLPVLLIGLLQVSGCVNSGRSSRVGGTYISTSAGAHFDQSVARVDASAGDTIASLALGRAHRPGFNSELVYIAAGHDGIAYSDDGGGSWRLMSAPVSVSDVVALENGVLIVSGVDGEGQGYVLRSIDEAKSWENVLTVPVPVKQSGFRFFGGSDPVPAVVIAITQDSFHADRLYAGTSLGNILVGEQSGKTWRTLETLAGGYLASSGQGALGIHDVVASPHQQGELAVLTTSGEMWLINKEQQQKLKITQPPDSPTPYSSGEKKLAKTMAFIPEFPNALFVGVDDGALISRDRGDTWERLQLPVDTIQAFNSVVVAVSPTNSARLFVGINSVIYRSEDGGATWNIFSLNIKSHIITDILIDASNASKALLVTTRLTV